MTFRVLKFGGSSLASPERVDRVVRLVAAERRLGPVALVVSALGASTDSLVAALDAASTCGTAQVNAAVDAFAESALANVLDTPAKTEVERLIAAVRSQLVAVCVLGEASLRTRDRILSAGELVSVQVVASRLRASGLDAKPVDARKWLLTDGRHSEARVAMAESTLQLQALRDAWGDDIPVVTGFIARNAEGHTTTLGRNGSDYSATLLAAGLRASEVQIWSDVSGVMTADPRIVADATPLTHLSYDEALELATFGASVLHPRTILPLLKTGILLRIRNTLDPDSPGTRVDTAGGNDETQATSVTSLEAQALIDVQLQTLDAGPRIAERVHRAVQETTETVWLATHSAHGQAMSIVVPQVEAQAVKAAIETALALEIDRGELKPLTVHGQVSLLTLVGEAMGRTPNVAGQMFSALGRVGINVRTIGQSASARSISCVVDSAVLPLAVRTVHTAFNLTHRRASIFLLGKGIVGSALLGQVAAQARTLREQHDVEPVVVGLADRARAVFNRDGLPPGTEAEQLANAPVTEGAWGPVSEAILDELATLPVPILVDCTASSELAPLYKAAWERGIHVVAANKKPLTLPLADVSDLRDTARRSHRDWRYETTVGAALPVIDTLQHLVRTGDSVTRIQGSLSGTLGYLCDELSAGVALGDAVRTAKAKGFTEPRPQEDLAGTDAARKALILARELGLQLEMSDVVIEPLVPAELLDIDDVDTFLSALDQHTELAETVAANRREGKVLRFIATVDPYASPQLHVGPIAVNEDHPAYSLRGPASLVAFSSRRYPDEPLVVQGAGAGGEVTAAGVLADILRLAMTSEAHPAGIS